VQKASASLPSPSNARDIWDYCRMWLGKNQGKKKKSKEGKIREADLFF
jgi:hypothetical protein